MQPKMVTPMKGCPFAAGVMSRERTASCVSLALRRGAPLAQREEQKHHGFVEELDHAHQPELLRRARLPQLRRLAGSREQGRVAVVVVQCGRR